MGGPVKISLLERVASLGAALANHFHELLGHSPFLDNPDRDDISSIRNSAGLPPVDRATGRIGLNVMSWAIALKRALPVGFLPDPFHH